MAGNWLIPNEPNVWSICGKRHEKIIKNMEKSQFDNELYINL